MQKFYMNIDDVMQNGFRRVIRLKDGYHYQGLIGGKWEDITIYSKPYSALIAVYQTAEVAMAFIMERDMS